MTRRTRKADRRRVSAKRYDADVQRLLDTDGKIIGFAMRLANGKWALNDTDDKRLSKVTFDTPGEVAAALERRLYPQPEPKREIVLREWSTEG